MVAGINTTKARPQTPGSGYYRRLTTLTKPNTCPVFDVPKHSNRGRINFFVALPLERSLSDVAVITRNGCASARERDHG